MIVPGSALGRSWLLLPLVAALLACAPKQRIPLEVGPGPVTVFIDGERLEGLPAEVLLRSDQGHVLFFRSEGYRPERVVLFSEERDGKPYLEPPAVRLRMVPDVTGSRSFEIQRAE